MNYQDFKEGLPTGPDISTAAPAFPPRKWLVSYLIEHQWGAKQIVGMIEVDSYWGFANFPKNQLHTDLILALTKEGKLEGIKGLGEYREKDGKIVYKANVYLLNREWAALFDGGYKL